MPRSPCYYAFGIISHLLALVPHSGFRFRKTSKNLQLSASGAFIINLDRNRAQFHFLIRCLAEIVARSFFTPFIHLLNYRRSQSSPQGGPTIQTKCFSCRITLDCFNQILQSSVARSKLNRLIQNTAITLECVWQKLRPFHALLEPTLA